MIQLDTLIISILGALSTFELSKTKYFDSLRSSALLSSIFYLLCSFFLVEYSSNAITWASVFFGSSFVGMCSEKRFERINIVIASLAFSYIYTFLSPSFDHLGGALGFSAFLAVLLSEIYFVGRNWLVKKIKEEHFEPVS